MFGIDNACSSALTPTPPSAAPAGRRSREPAGRTLWGLATPSGSNAARRRAWASRSSSPNCHGMKSRFSRPMPCSPDSTPPAASDARDDLVAGGVHPIEHAGLAGVEHEQRVQVAVAGVEDVHHEQVVRGRDPLDLRQHLDEPACAARPCRAGSSSARSGPRRRTPTCAPSTSSARSASSAATRTERAPCAQHRPPRRRPRRRRRPPAARRPRRAARPRRRSGTRRRRTPRRRAIIRRSIISIAAGTTPAAMIADTASAAAPTDVEVEQQRRAPRAAPG